MILKGGRPQALQSDRITFPYNICTGSFLSKGPEARQSHIALRSSGKKGPPDTHLQDFLLKVHQSTPEGPVYRELWGPGLSKHRFIRAFEIPSVDRFFYHLGGPSCRSVGPLSWALDFLRFVCLKRGWAIRACGHYILGGWWSGLEREVGHPSGP